MSNLPLQQRKCLPCEGGVPPVSLDEANDWLESLAEWTLSEDGLWISRQITFPNFKTALAALNRIGEIAETEQHHPDLHLTAYRKLKIALTTHAIGGLSENDFILAAKIDESLPS